MEVSCISKSSKINVFFELISIFEFISAEYISMILSFSTLEYIMYFNISMESMSSSLRLSMIIAVISFSMDFLINEFI